MASEIQTNLATTLSDFRRALHRQPELSLQEVQTTEKIRAFLVEHQVELVETSLQTGVVAVIRGQHDGPCIALRADIDALPIQELTELDFASEVVGKMHACGHDFHTTALLGAACLLQTQAQTSSSFAGTVLLIFQPAEEIGEGAKLILDTGVFREFGVRAIIGEHNQPFLQTGHIGVKSGSLMGSVDEFRVVVHGKGGHAAIPDATVDPLLIAANLIFGLQHLVSRRVSPLQSAVVTVGQFHAGTARNIIPSYAVFEGTVRALSPAVRDTVEAAFRQFVSSTASAYGATATIEYIRQLPVVSNDEWVTHIVREAAQAVVGDNRVVAADPTLGGEDFAVYQTEVPGCFFWVGTGRPDGTSEGWHHPSFDVDESMLPVTSQIFYEASLRLLRAIAE